MPNKAVEDDGDKRIFFGLRDLSRSLRSRLRASSLASLSLSPPRLTADVRLKKSYAKDASPPEIWEPLKTRCRVSVDGFVWFYD